MGLPPNWFGYMGDVLVAKIEDLTNAEFDPCLWGADPDMDVLARDLRDLELLLDLPGNLDSPCA